MLSARSVLYAVLAAIAAACAARASPSPSSSCAPLLRGVAFGTAPEVRPLATLGVPSAATAPALCCAACDANASCAAWTVRWNLYHAPPAPQQSSCILFPALPQPWAQGRATPPFECDPQYRPGKSKGPPPYSADGCVKFTVTNDADTVSGHKPRAGPVVPAPPPPPSPNPPATGRRPNILYLVADDMRPQLKSYGHEQMLTPNLDKLAAMSLQFDFAYTQFAYCAPSRNSWLSGRRPDRTRAVNFLSTFRDTPNGTAWVTMPQIFKLHGWWTSSAGKVFHDGMDDAPSWTFPSKQTAWISCKPGDRTFSRSGPVTMTGNETDFNPSMQNAGCTVTASSSMPLTNENISIALGLERLDLARASGRPWWVSIGVHRPHAPFRSGEGFEAEVLYPNLSGPLHPLPPNDSPYMAGNYQGEDITNVYGVGSPAIIVQPVITIELRRYYYAATTYADHMLGMALDKLSSFGSAVEDNTIVVFHSDHGYQLGELGEWSKKTNYELATRVPLLVRVPWMPAAAGRRVASLVELVDIYRTLADLAGFESDVQPDVQGTSLAPLFADPDHPPASLADRPAFSQIARCKCGVYTCWAPTSCNPKWNESWYDPHGGTRGCNPLPGLPSNRSCFQCRGKRGAPPPPPQCGWSGTECGGNACAQVPVNEFDFMGYSMRTRTRRFTTWVRWDTQLKQSDWSLPVEHELFDLTGDDGSDFDFAGYSRNLAGLPEFAAEVAQLHRQLELAAASWP